MREPVLAFRSSFRQTYLVILGWSLLLAISLALFGWGLHSARGGQRPVDDAGITAGVLFGLVTGVVLAFVLTLAAVWYFQVYLNSEGLRCYNFWGKYNDVAWSDIREIKPINLLGLKYLLVYSDQFSSPLWLPIFLHRQQRFQELVVLYAGPSHPLTAVFAGTPEG